MICFEILCYNKTWYAINAITSILRSCPEPFEILVYEGSPDKGNQEEMNLFLNNLQRKEIKYLPDGRDLGFARSFNWMTEHWTSPEADILIQMSEDMFFGPNTIRDLLYLARLPEVGIATCGAYPPPSGEARLHPKLEDVDWFFRAHSTTPWPPTYGFSGSFPFCMRKEVWNKLKITDVWIDACLPKNRFGGAMDEGIDPSPFGWHGDWDLTARLKPLGLRRACVDNSQIYHYDHVSCEVLDKSNPEWVLWSRRNYQIKYPRATLMHSDDQNAFEKIPYNPDFAPRCPEPWAVHQDL